MAGDVLDVVEKAYRLDIGAGEWLRDVTRAVYDHLGDGRGALGFYYRVGDDGRVKMGESVEIDMPSIPPPMRGAVESLPPSFVQKSFARLECTTQSAALDDEMEAVVAPIMEAATAAFGWRDIVMLGGVDPGGEGVYVGAWLGERTRLSPRVRDTWSRVAVHVASGNRLRRRLADGGEIAGDRGDAISADHADAILRPDGRVEDARGEAQTSEARTALRDAVARMERARGTLRRDDPDAAVETWRGLVASRWSLVDHFETGGQRYVLARRNEPLVRGWQALTGRELQALGWAAMGHGNKLIAYEMGISASTVGVLLHRAARKLGAATRDELVTIYRRRAAD